MDDPPISRRWSLNAFGSCVGLPCACFELQWLLLRYFVAIHSQDLGIPLVLCGNEPASWTDALLKAPSSSNTTSAMIAVVEFNLIHHLR